MQDAPYREIPLRRNDGSVAAICLVDPEDFERFGHLRWSLSNGYAVRGNPQVRMHRLILGLEFGTHAQNGQNRRHGHGASRYRGVSRLDGKWRANCMVDGVDHFLGLYDGEREAAKAAAEGRRRLMPYSTN